MENSVENFFSMVIKPEFLISTDDNSNFCLDATS